MAERTLHLPLKKRCLDRRWTRWPLAVIESVRLTWRRRSSSVVVPWRGWWIHWSRGGVFISPGPRGIPPRRLELVVLDTFCHEYVPSAGDAIVDVGAGSGEELPTFSRLAGPDGRVVCVEAHPRTYDRLLATIRLNRLRNVEAANLAVADRPGTAQISDKPTQEYASNTTIPQGGDSIAVAADTLDGVYRRFGLERVDLLKMNIEGAEAFAISGWEEALRRTRHLAIACHDFLAEDGGPADFATFERIKSAVERAGFTVTTRDDDRRPWNRYYVYGARVDRRRER